VGCHVGVDEPFDAPRFLRDDGHGRDGVHALLLSIRNLHTYIFSFKFFKILRKPISFLLHNQK
jgi:hypothetical protein